ncbi:MAG: DUF364 domain-containing protein [Thermodesulfobacteriota bacterium]
MKTHATAPGQDDILAALLGQALARPDSRVSEVRLGAHLAVVRAGEALGLASRSGGHDGPAPIPPADRPATLHALARLLAEDPEPFPQARALALAAVNALLPPPAEAAPAQGQDLLLALGRGKRAAVVGHFPFVERMAGEFSSLDVLEMSPRPGDLPAAAAREVLPRADLAAITATTLLNGTLAGLLALLRPGTEAILLGPSTPFASALFRFGVTVLAGCAAADPAAVLEGVARGLPFKALPGVRRLAWRRPGG